MSAIRRKSRDWDELRRLLYSRNPAFLEHITWRGLAGLSEADYAREICRSTIFLNLSPAALHAVDPGFTWAGWNVPVLLQLVILAVLGLITFAIAVQRFSKTD